MKRFWIALCGVLGMALYVGTAHAAFWQVVRDTPIREDASTDARRLDTARKGWIVNDMTGSGSSPQWIKVVEVQKHIGDGMAYAHLLYRTPDAYISAADVVQVEDEMEHLLRRPETLLMLRQHKACVWNLCPHPRLRI